MRWPRWREEGWPERWREQWQRRRAGAWALLATGVVLAVGQWAGAAPAQVAVVARPLAQGARIGAGDVKGVSLNRLMAGGQLLAARAAIGRYAARNLPAGSVLTAASVRPTPPGEGEVSLALPVATAAGVGPGSRVVVVVPPAAAGGSVWRSPPVRVLAIQPASVTGAPGQVVVAMPLPVALALEARRPGGGQVEVLGWNP